MSKPSCVYRLICDGNKKVSARVTSVLEDRTISFTPLEGTDESSVPKKLLKSVTLSDTVVPRDPDEEEVTTVLGILKEQHPESANVFHKSDNPRDNVLVLEFLDSSSSKKQYLVFEKPSRKVHFCKKLGMDISEDLTSAMLLSSGGTSLGKKIRQSTKSFGDSTSKCSEQDMSCSQITVEPEEEYDVPQNNVLDKDEKKLAKKRIFGSKGGCIYGADALKEDPWPSFRQEMARKRKATSSFSSASATEVVSSSMSMPELSTPTDASGKGGRDAGGRDSKKGAGAKDRLGRKFLYWTADEILNAHLSCHAFHEHILGVFSGQVDMVTIGYPVAIRSAEELLTQKKLAFQPCVVGVSLFTVIGVLTRGRRLFLNRHLWDIKYIVVNSDKSAVHLVFKDGKSVLLFIPSPIQFAQSLLNSLQYIQVKSRFPKVLPNPIDLPSSYVLPPEYKDSGLRPHPAIMFESFCVYNNIPINKTLYDIIGAYAQRKVKHLDLTCLSGLQESALQTSKNRKDSAAAPALTPVDYLLQFLEFDVYFTRISCSGKTSAGVGTALARAVANQSKLESITIVDCPDEEKKMFEFVNCLSEIKSFSALNSLCLKHCCLGDKGFKELGTVMFGSNAVWKEIVLEDCGGTPKGIAAMLEQMKNKVICFQGLRTFSLSSNKLEDIGTKALDDFFGKMGTVFKELKVDVSLSSLGLANTKVNTGLLTNMKYLKNLEELDISGCVFTDKGLENFGDTFKRLKRIRLIDMLQPRDEVFQQILGTFALNTVKGDSVRITLGSRDVDSMDSMGERRRIKKAMSVLDSTINASDTSSESSVVAAKLPFNIFPDPIVSSPAGKNIVSMNFYCVVMTPSCLSLISKTYSSKKTLQSLHISFVPPTCFTDTAEWSKAILSLVKDIKTLRSLELSQGFALETLVPMFEHLAAHKTHLLSLIVSFNELGDKGLKYISDIIAFNAKYLHEIRAEEAGFSVAACREMLNVLEKNTNITRLLCLDHLPPSSEVSGREAKAMEAKHEERREYYARLKPILQRNFDAFAKTAFAGFFPDKTNLPRLQYNLAHPQFDFLSSKLPVSDSDIECFMKESLNITN